MLWMAELDTLSHGRPQLLKNHYTRQKEVIVQDATDQLYLFSPDGEMLWKRDIEGQILGEVHHPIITGDFCDTTDDHPVLRAMKMFL